MLEKRRRIRMVWQRWWAKRLLFALLVLHGPLEVVFDHIVIGLGRIAFGSYPWGFTIRLTADYGKVWPSENDLTGFTVPLLVPLFVVLVWRWRLGPGIRMRRPRYRRLGLGARLACGVTLLGLLVACGPWQFSLRMPGLELEAGGLRMQARARTVGRITYSTSFGCSWIGYPAPLIPGLVSGGAMTTNLFQRFGKVIYVSPWPPLVLLSGWAVWRWRQPKQRDGNCPFCGYDQRGNQSGVCPECGSPVPVASEPL